MVSTDNVLIYVPSSLRVPLKLLLLAATINTIWISVLFPLAAAQQCTRVGCPRGYYSDCSTVCVPCSPGYYCMGNFSQPAACPAGTYNGTSGAMTLKDCTPCPGGFISPSGSSFCTACPARMYVVNVYAGCQYCPSPSQVVDGGTCVECSLGFYASNSTGQCEPCSAGFACPSRTVDMEIPCAPGTWSQLGEGYCQGCPAGSACPAPTRDCGPLAITNKVACQAGWYSDVNQTSCTPCPPQNYCPNTTLPLVYPCPPASYSTGAAYACTPCDPGYVCDPSINGGLPSLCPGGTYLNGTNCQICEAGFQCPTPTTKSECSIGYYSPSGATSCTPCPLGNYCPPLASAPIPCPVGQYADQIAMGLCEPCNDSTPVALFQLSEGATNCNICPPGYACPNASAPPVICPVGTFSAGGQYACMQCAIYGGPSPTSPNDPSVATYALGLGSTQCFVCPAGYFCNGTNILQCPQGYFSGYGAFNCSICPAGFECPSQAVGPKRCPLGTYSIQGSTQCLTCPANFYCPNADGIPIPCNAELGEFSVPGSSACSICATGYTCSIDPATGNVTGTQCKSGTYQSGTSCITCPPGMYCPFTNTVPLPCPRGTYSIYGSTTCFMCPAGMRCPGEATTLPCAIGYYSLDWDDECQVCPNGHKCVNPWSAPVPCPWGTFSNGQATNCTSCPAGYYCPSVKGFIGLPCQPGYYSTGGATYCTMCPAGYACPYTDQEVVKPCPIGTYSTAGQTNCTACPAGFYCTSTNYDAQPPTPCPLGSFSLGYASEGCTPCTAGYACPYTTANYQIPCQNGTFTGPGEALCIVCAAGHYCPQTAVNASQPFFGDAGYGRQIPCQPGTFAAPGSIACQACPNGYICPTTVSANGDMIRCPLGYRTLDAAGNFVTSGAVQCSPCPTGYDCSVGGATPVSCAPGFLATVSGCVACPPGYACPDPTAAEVPCSAGTYGNNASTSCTTCTAGFLCRDLATDPTPTDSYCPLGYYCPAGAIEPVVCPAGTFGRLVRATSQASACVDCMIGYYCPAATAGITSQIPCPEGYYCPTASPTPIACPQGTYSTEKFAGSRATCKTCPPGYFCPAGSWQFTPNPCPRGFYCPTGTSTGFDNPCPIGTYGQDHRLVSASQCLSCAPGFYCPTSGLAAPLPCSPGSYQPAQGSTACRDCEPGWACPRWNMSTYLGNPCAAGHFCPMGTINPTDHVCTAGSYTFQTKLISDGDCEVCWSGFYCPRGTGYSPAVPQPCPAGYYCPGAPIPATGQSRVLMKNWGGLTTAYGTQYPCPAGSYSKFTNLSSATQCLACPAGYYCIAGATNVTGLCSPGYYCPLNSSSPMEIACPAGTFGEHRGSKNVTDCLSCTVGNYCPANSSAPTPCPAGSYMPYTGATMAGPPRAAYDFTCLSCPAGYSCSEGSATPSICPPGSFSAVDAPSCSECPVGSYCPLSGITNTDLINIFVCPATLFCTAGMSRVPNGKSDACPAGYYCPAGTTAPVPCPTGTFNPVTQRGNVTECIPCTPGYYCDAPGLTAVSGDCDPGYYCPAGSSSYQQVPCPARYYRSHARGEDPTYCSVCPRGFYCPSGSSIPTPCPQGYYCPTGSSSPYPCPMGTFANITGMRSQQECTLCSPGSYCNGLGLATPTGLCNPGYFCLNGATTSAPPGLPTGGICPSGGYCPAGSSFPTACAEGTFNNYTGGTSQADCRPCLPGYYCSGSNNPGPTGPCSAGYYCISGAYLPTQFTTPVGHYSLAGAAAPTECPLGTFGIQTGQSSCLPCIAGYYCPTQGMSNYLPCPVGSYCPTGSALPTACPVGTYQPGTKSQNVSDCLTCPPGKYCAQSNATTYTGNCSAGFYCLRSCVTATCNLIVNSLGNIVPHSPTTFTQDDSYGGICPYGKYCPVGTAVPYLCPIGTYFDGTGAEAVSSCAACLPGFYCNVPGMSTLLSGALLPNPCGVGYYCPGEVPGETYGCMDSECSQYKSQPCSLSLIGCWGTTNTDLASSTPGPRTCPTGFYCPAGSVLPVVCPLLNGGKSTYAPRRGQTDCNICPPGLVCDPLNITSLQTPYPCPRGHYCPEGSTSINPPCPPGSYNPNYGAANITQCKLCPPGRYCPWEGMYNTYESQMLYCPPGYFCTAGVADYLGNPGKLGGRGGPCLPGYYCPNGTAYNYSYPCPPGTYNPFSKASSVTNCLPCPPGMYCLNDGSAQPSGECQRGYYCPRNCIDPLCTSNSMSCLAGIVPKTSWTGGPCPVGYYCPPGSIMPQPCPPGSYQSSTHAYSCMPCPEGHYCELASPGPVSCPPGTYCPQQTSADNIPLCPPGTYQPLARQANFSSCLLCPPGQYCALEGMNYTSGPCTPGFWCSSGALQPNGTVGVRGGSGGPCPVGYYCPLGTQSPHEFPCPVGTYNPAVRATNASMCVRCTPGFYCQYQAQSAVSGPCASGYYCPTGCKDAQCSNRPCPTNCAQPMPYEPVIKYAMGGICPPAHYCPQQTDHGVLTGAASPFACLAGFYAPSEGYGSCLPCPAGHWCGVRTTTPQPCPSGFYCSNMTQAPTDFPCPAGSVNWGVNATNIRDCALCPAGYACGSPGMSTTTTLCAAGFWCGSGATTVTGIVGILGGSGGICAPGYYCPPGTNSMTEHPCPPGTYQPYTHATNESSCIPCVPGTYCPNYAMTATGPSCQAGYFCPRGCADAMCTNMPCSRNCADTINYPYKSGQCIAGFYCPPRTILPLPCPIGTYSSSGADACTVCPVGYYCPGQTAHPISCPRGYYCPGGTGFNWRLCPPGTFGLYSGAGNLSTCAKCSPGNYCSGYGQATVSASCFAGYYCESGAMTGRGQPGPLGGKGGACPPGYYCPAGTAYPNQYPCPSGTFQPSFFATSSTLCERCLPGYYCEGEGNANVTSVCAVGYYCPGSCSSSQCMPCPEQNYCALTSRVYPVLTNRLGATRLSGALQPSSCPAGQYAPNTSSATCISCPAGFYCPGGSLGSVPRLCRMGYYCPAGTGTVLQPCPPGSIGTIVGANSSSQCKLCPGGLYCGSRGQTVPSGLCAPGYFCSGGAADPYGNYGVLGGLLSYFPRNQLGQQECPIGYYCPAGSSNPVRCPAGTYNPTPGLYNYSQCLLCDAGKFCAAPGLTQPTGLCLGGYLCIRGCITSDCSQLYPATGCTGLTYGPCPIGYYCPNGTATPIPCPSGFYSSHTGAVECTMCPARFYCTLGAVIPLPCPVGDYCPPGTASSSIPQCPAGSFSNRTQLVNASECTLCLPQKACTVAGLIQPDQWCVAGYYCMSGAATPQGTLGPLGGSAGPCPVGHYCPPSTSEASPCPIGTINPKLGAENVTQCRPCPSGYYCSGIGQSSPSGECDAGWYCQLGQTVPRPPATGCPTGHYCLRGSVAPLTCPRGTYQPVRNATSSLACLQCPPGYYCLAGSSIPTGHCTGGYLCLGGNYEPNPEYSYCTAGYYCPVGATVALPCPPSQYCSRDKLAAPDGYCSAGYYCTLRSTSPRPTNASVGGICPMGFYCPNNASRPIPCSPGTYQPILYQWSSAGCLPCPASFYCPLVAQRTATDICAAGYYCPPGQVVPNPAKYICPIGYRCPAGVKSPIMCADGEYQNEPGQSICKTCPEGYYCMSSSLCPLTNYTFPRPCPAGYYCPAGTSAAQSYPCPAGTYSNALGLVNVSQCIRCDPGLYCPVPGSTIVSNLKCSPGFYCIGGAVSPMPTDGVTGDRCTPGHYCLLGSSSPAPCPLGTFSPNTGLPSEAQCSTCPAGYYCNSSGLLAPSGSCAEGYYCPAGSTIDTVNICPFGMYCPAASPVPSRCPSGQFATGFGKISCVPCPPGSYCDMTQPCRYCNASVPISSCFNNYTCPRTCPLGHYCPQGTQWASQYPCPAGRYGKNVGLGSVSECVSCPTGNYCPYPGLSIANALLCSAGYWCINGSGTPQPNDGVTGVRCPAGFYCPVGTLAPLPCPSGTYNPAFGSANISQCVPCSAGKACTRPGLSSPNANCSAGYYCSQGLYSPAVPQYTCPFGFYCPAGSAAPRICPSGFYVNAKGRATCMPCPAGYYCNYKNLCNLNYTVPVICPIGYYCPLGTMFGQQYPCPRGTYGNASGLTSILNCTDCEAGKACGLTGSVASNMYNCSESYYCIGNATRPDPQDDSTGAICPPGYYCPSGTATPLPCPVGTFNNGTGLYGASQCQPCLSGYFCQTPGLSQPTGLCYGGYYCPPGQSEPNPSAYVCPAGLRCPEGSGQPVQCADGTQSIGQAGMTECSPCLRGYFCNIVEQQKSPYFLPGEYVLQVPCPRGYYCPTGTASQFDYPCPPGTYRNTSGLVSPTQCYPCPPTLYCLNPGQIKPTGVCEAGYYCASGSNMSNPAPPMVPSSNGGPCPPGNYCPFGSSTGIPCPPGSYFNGTYATNSSFCKPCQAGSYCSTPGNIDGQGQGDCSPGYYCPGGDSSPTPYMCPIGHFCGSGTALPIPCPAGTYNQLTGQVQCTECPMYFFCSIGTVNPTQCRQGVVCPPGSPNELVCPKGSYIQNTNAILGDFSQCTACPAGKFCLNGTISGNCAAGYLCISGNLRADPNSATNGPLSGASGVKIGGICPLGYYCPSGTTAALPCMNNTVGLTTGLQASSDCSPCQPGYYCVSNSIYPIPCPRGYYCPGFITSTTGLYRCPAGTYNSMMYAPDISWCLPCLQGYYCPLDGMASTYLFPTPTGYYSSVGYAEPQPCPAGTWSNENNGTANNVTACQTCPTGYYCPPTSSTYNNTPCPVGYLCPYGSYQPQQCPGGYYCPALAAAPIPCPEGYFCNSEGGSTSPTLCWIGSYCPNITEIPLICPDGYVGVNTSDPSFLRVTLNGSCVACPPGTWSNNSVNCEPCGAGHVCLGATTAQFPVDNATQHGYVCAVGTYCPEGSFNETLCPVGTYRNVTGGQNITDCTPCPVGYFNDNEGSSICTFCGPSANSTVDATSCFCVGANRVYLPLDYSCRCAPGYVFYTTNSRHPEADGTSDCVSIVYENCQVGYARTSTGHCVSANDATLCSQCGAQGGTINTGVCVCNGFNESASSICDANCLASSSKVRIDNYNGVIIHYDPSTGVETAVPSNASNIVGDKGCSGSIQCDVAVMQLSDSGPLGVFNPSAATCGISGSLATSSTRRQLLQSIASVQADLSLSDPIVCINLNSAMMWALSSTNRTHYPVYDKDNLLNTNPNFDYTLFLDLAVWMADPNYIISSFVFTFTESGIYVFYDNALPNQPIIIRVPNGNESCPDGSFLTATIPSLLTIGATLREDIVLSPQWVMVGVLLAGVALLGTGFAFGLWQIRKATWGSVGNALPKYRNLAMEHLAAKSAGVTSRGFVRVSEHEKDFSVITYRRSRPITLRLDTPVHAFNPKQFMQTVAALVQASLENIVILSISEGSTVVRFEFANCDDPQKFADELIRQIRDDTHVVHVQLPILAFDAGEGDVLSYRNHPAYAMSNIRDEYWDYDRVVDSKNFDVRTLYDKLEDQTLQVVSTLASQSDDMASLCDKILVESEALKDMFVRVKAEVDRGNAKDVKLLEIRGQKMSGGQVEFELPDDLKVTLSEFIRQYFDKSLADTEKGIDDRKRKEAEAGEKERMKALKDVEGQIAALDAAAVLGPSAASNDVVVLDTAVNAPPMVDDAIEAILASDEKPIRTPANEFPLGLDDDSDLEDDERISRAARREENLATKLRRVRRIMDAVIMPTGLDEIPVSTGIRSAEEVLRVAKARAEWKAARKAEQRHFDEELKELGDVTTADGTVDQILQKSSEKCDRIYNRLWRLRTALEAVNVPVNLQDSEALTADERNARTEKRIRFIRNKLHKARKAYAVATASFNWDVDNNTEPAVAARRRQAAEEYMRSVLDAHAAISDIPLFDVANLSPEQRNARRAAADKALRQRVAAAASLAALLSLPRDASDHSDLDDAERQRRAGLRQDPSGSTTAAKVVSKTRKTGGAKTKTAAPAVGDTAVTLRKEDIATLLDIRRNGPKGFADDEDLDDDERAHRRELRAAYKAGLEAPFNASLPANDREGGISASEQRRRRETNEAFKNGQATAFGIEPTELVSAAREATRRMEVISKDPEQAKYAALGQAAQRSISSDLKKEASGDLQAAFLNGRRAEIVSEPFIPLSSARAKVFLSGRDKGRDIPAPTGLTDLEAAVFEMGQQVERDRTFDAAITAETNIGNAEVAAAMRVAHERGKLAGQMLAVPADLKTPEEVAAFALAAHGVDITIAAGRNAPRSVMVAADRGGKARAEVMELIEEWRDTVPLLSPEKVVERTACRAAFLIGLQGVAGSTIIEALQAENRLRDYQRTQVQAMFAAGRKAQKDVDSIPGELTADEQLNYIRGRTAAHLAVALSEVPVSNPHAAQLRVAAARGVKDQRALMRVPPELAEDADVPEPEAQRRAKCREAYFAGQRAESALNLSSEVELSRVLVRPPASENIIVSDLTAVGEAPTPSDDELTRRIAAKKDEYQRAMKALKVRHQLEASSALEELEEEIVAEASQLDRELDDQFLLERKKLTAKQETELLQQDPNKTEGLKARHATQLQSLAKSQEETRKAAQDLVVKRGNEKKQKLKTILAARAMNELRLQKTLALDEEKEIKRLFSESEADAARGQLSRDDEFERQKQKLMAQIQARERRLKVRNAKEKEFLEQELRDVSALKESSLEALIKDRRNVFVQRQQDLAQRGLLDPRELEEQQDRIERDMAAEQQRRLAILKTELAADVIERERALAEETGKHTQELLQEARAEVETLLQQQKAERSKLDENKKASSDAEAAAMLLARQEEQRRQLKRELEETRKSEAQLLAQDEAKVHAEAERLIALRESEGQRLSEAQKRAILEDCERDAARLKEALSDEQRSQISVTQKKIEERRRRKEMELRRKQSEEQQKELERQELEAQRRAEAVKKEVKVAPVQLSEDAQKLQTDLERHKARAIEEVERAHREEQEAADAELREAHEREIQALEAAAKEKMAAFRAQQEQSLTEAREEDRQAMIQQFEAENRRFESATKAEAESQREKLQAAIAAKRQKREAELARKHADELEATRRREDENAAAALKASRMEAEQKAIVAALAVSRATGDKAADLAVAVMGDRHREETQRLFDAQQARRESERRRLADLKSAQLESAAPASRGALEIEIDERNQNVLDALEIELTEQRMKLRIEQLNEVASASGMASPEEVMQRFRQKVSKQTAAEADDELRSFVAKKQAEQDAIAAKLAKEAAEFEARLAEQVQASRQAQEKEFLEKEQAMLRQLEQEKLAREKRLMDARQSGAGGASSDQQSKARERLIEESKQDEERLRVNLQLERDRQKQEFEDRIKRRKERQERQKTIAMEQMKQNIDVSGTEPPPPSVPVVLASASLRPQLEALRDSLVASVPRATDSVQQRSGPSFVTDNANVSQQGGNAAYDSWIAEIATKIAEDEDVMRRVHRIEQKVESQSNRYGLLHYFADRRDQELGSNEGVLQPIDVAELTTEQFIVYFFGNALRNNIARSGVTLPPVNVAVARKLPHVTTGLIAFRNSYFFNADRRMLFIRESRLATIGEFSVVLLHALAHIKASTDMRSWNDTDPKFLREFYGLMEMVSEETFFMRLPQDKVSRDVSKNRPYRPESIMSAKSLNEIEDALRKVSRPERESYLRTFLQL